MWGSLKLSIPTIFEMSCCKIIMNFTEINQVLQRWQVLIILSKLHKIKKEILIVK